MTGVAPGADAAMIGQKGEEKHTMSRSKLTTAEIAKRKREGRYHDGTKPLTAKRVQALKGEGRYHDALVPGLYLQVTASGARSWLLRFELNGKERMMGLGSCAIFTLAHARERAREARRLIADGIDPLTQRQAERAAAAAAAAKAMTFAEAAQKYFDQNAGTWSNRSWRDQFLGSLRAYAKPILNMNVADIGLPNVLACIESQWLTKTVTMDRVRGRIAAVLDWCTTRGLRKGENPARWEGFLDQILPQVRKVAPVVHHAAMPYADLPAFMLKLRSDDTVPARAFEFLILTAARRGKVMGATWSEIDLDAATWTIPAARMKTRTEHRVPLSSQAIELLKKLPTEDGNPYVFIGRRLRGLGKNFAEYAMDRFGRTETIHGFRATFKTWASAETAFPRETIERSLAHAIGSKVEQAYERGDALEKRRQLMAAWSRYCATPRAAARTGDVVGIGGVRA
jgi:integrase